MQQRTKEEVTVHMATEIVSLLQEVERLGNMNKDLLSCFGKATKINSDSTLNERDRQQLLGEIFDAFNGEMHVLDEVARLRGLNVELLAMLKKIDSYDVNRPVFFFKSQIRAVIAKCESETAVLEGEPRPVGSSSLTPDVPVKSEPLTSQQERDIDEAYERRCAELQREKQVRPGFQIEDD